MQMCILKKDLLTHRYNWLVILGIYKLIDTELGSTQSFIQKFRQFLAKGN